MTQNDVDADDNETNWIPIGATYGFGSWSVLWAKRTDGGWAFREGSVGLNHVEPGTPDGVRTRDGDR